MPKNPPISPVQSAARVPLTVFASSFLLFLCGVLILVFFRGFIALLGLVIIVLSMIDVSSLLTLKITLHSTLSDKGVFIKYGFTRRVDDFLPFDEIQNMRIKQSWLGKKLGYGSVILLGKRFGVSIQYIEYPEKYLQEIQSSLLASTNTQPTPHT